MISHSEKYFPLQFSRQDDDAMSAISVVTDLQTLNQYTAEYSPEEQVAVQQTEYNSPSTHRLRDKIQELTNQCINNIDHAPNKWKTVIIASFVSFVLSFITLMGCLIFGGARITTTVPSEFQNANQNIESRIRVSFSPSNELSSFPSSTPSIVTQAPSKTPTYFPTFVISGQPSIPPSDKPSLFSTSEPTKTLSIFPSYLSHDPSQTPSKEPSHNPTSKPTGHPTFQPTLKITNNPTHKPTITPTEHPTHKPTVIPTDNPSKQMTESPTKSTPLIFYVMGDIPYNDNDAIIMTSQIENLPEDGSFLMHVGDINNVVNNGCEEWAFRQASGILEASKTPVFIVPGDNDWNQCPDPVHAMDIWKFHFHTYENRWNHAFNVDRSSEKTIFFSFVESEIIFIGIHITGPPINDQATWDELMIDNVKWVVRKVQKHKAEIKTIVILGHARMSRAIHSIFIDNISTACGNWQIPMLYIHGDGHIYEERWGSDASIFKCEYAIEVQVDMGRRGPPLKVMVDNVNPQRFTFDRRLPKVNT